MTEKATTNRSLPVGSVPRRPRFADPVDNARGWRFICRSGRLSLNFAATLTGVGRRDTERLTASPLMSEWCRRVELAADPPDFSHPDLAAARRLREAIHAVALAIARDALPAPTDVASINIFAATPLGPPVLDPTARTARPPALATAHEVLSAIARDAIELFSGPTRDRVRECEHEDCTVLFVDTSRSGNRRWCAMSPCGNKINSHMYRARQRTRSPADDQAEHLNLDNRT
ncbi:CGNR zinc finger domain-containing protein [Phytohabitans suffuscus]|uniref:Zinc finger CGNR domain-containing protein n=2 Tax=Phytohabitans suffuscus TaxID=624315 RepID=A0A6F8YFC0_9ACTN|nr:hypothetical protein Psuf_020800 [Phytohabitans suffuscus]